MKNAIVVSEGRSIRWKLLLYASAIFTLVAFAIFLRSENVLWTGIFRLAAFIGFSSVILSLLKVMEGSKDLHVYIKDGNLLIEYIKKGEVVQEEVFDTADITSIRRERSPSPIPFAKVFSEGSERDQFFMTLRDSDRELPLFKFGGRTLGLEADSAFRLEKFLEQAGLSIQNINS